MSPSKQEDKVQIQYLQSLIPPVEGGQDVILGLSQNPKILPPKYFYDALGSQLFEQICELPEYYLTRTETAILQEYAPEIVALTGICQLIELGSGSSSKTRLLLDAYQNLGQPWQYVPIDVSGAMLKTTALQLEREYLNLSIHGLVGTYEQALSNLPPTALPQRMVMFLGSSLGNFNQQECDRLFTQITDSLEGGDYFLLGIDLEKPKEILEPAYNDAQGITAAFNLNVLSHLNWRFQGNFDLDLFSHQAIYNQVESQIEMYLYPKQSHGVSLDALDLQVNFTAQEPILTEISRKFALEIMKMELRDKGLVPVKSWTDSQGWFGLILSRFS